MKHDTTPPQAPGYDFAAPGIPSVAEIARRVSEDSELVTRRAALLTTLTHIPIFMGLEPRQKGRRRKQLVSPMANTIPFVPAVLRAAMNKADPIQHELSRKSILNDRSNINFLLDHYGLGGLRQYLGPLTEGLKRFYDDLADKYLKTGLSRFLHYLAAKQLCLQDVDDAVSHEFLAALEREGLIRDPRVTHQNMCRAWNRAADRLRLNTVRKLTVPRYRQPWAFRWDQFSVSLQAEVDQFLTANEGGVDLFDESSPAVPLKPRTILTQKDWIRVLASAAVRAGTPIEVLQTLTDLVEPDRYKAALSWLVDRRNGEVSSYLTQIAYVGRKVAKYASNLSAAEVQQVERAYKRVSMRATSNRKPPIRHERLKQFEDRKNVLRLIALGQHVVNEIMKRGTEGQKGALEIQMALAHELLLATGLRRQNLISLDLSRHFLRSGTTESPKCRIRIEAHEVKNGVVLDKELPPPVIRLLELYLEKYRPLFADEPTAHLFPGKNGNHKRATTFGQQYKRFVRRWTGLIVTPHLMRSFADLLYTERHPEGGEVMRRQLGHKSAETRLAHYADPRSRAANRAYLEVFLDERETGLRYEDRLFG